MRLFTKSTAIQYASDGIRCNSIHPGAVETEMVAEMPSGSVRAAVEARLPLGRIAQPSEVAYGAIYLASDESSFVTGSELVIDGGTTAA